MTDSNIQLTNEENTATPYCDDERHGDSMNNDFVKPDEQSSSLLESSAMARNCTNKNDFVKPDEQSLTDGAARGEAKIALDYPESR